VVAAACKIKAQPRLKTTLLIKIVIVLSPPGKVGGEHPAPRSEEIKADADLA